MIFSMNGRSINLDIPGLEFSAFPSEQSEGPMKFAAGSIVGTLTTDPILSRWATDFKPVGFVAPLLMPRVEVNTDTDAFQYIKWDKSSAFRKYDANRADGTAAKEIIIKGELATGALTQMALAYRIGDRQKAALTSVDIGQKITSRILSALDLLTEVRVANLFQNIAAISHTGGGDASAALSAANHVDLVATPWTTATTIATLRSNLQAGATAIRKAVGRKPNTWILSPAAAEIIGVIMAEQIKYIQSQNPILTNNLYGLPPRLFDMDIVIPEAIYNTSEVEGTSSLSDIWAEAISTLAYIDKSSIPDENNVSAVYNFYSRWRRVRNFRLEEALEGQCWEISDINSERRIASDALYIIENCI